MQIRFYVQLRSWIQVDFIGTEGSVSRLGSLFSLDLEFKWTLQKHKGKFSNLVVFSLGLGCTWILQAHKSQFSYEGSCLSRTYNSSKLYRNTRVSFQIRFCVQPEPRIQVAATGTQGSASRFTQTFGGTTR